MKLTHAEIKQIAIDVMEDFGGWHDDGTLVMEEDQMLMIADQISQRILFAETAKKEGPC